MRESFRVLAEARPSADVRELPGLSIASLGARFQMFNAVFLSGPVITPADLEDRLTAAAAHFRSLNLRWSLWVCEDWLSCPVRRILSRRCEAFSLRLASEMPGMVADRLRPMKRPLPALECLPVDSERRLADFHGIGAISFHVPMDWFSEVFNAALPTVRPRFRCWVGYSKGEPVVTAATVQTPGVLGLYNIATAPPHRKRGYAEAITRCLVNAAAPQTLVLQSTAHGYRLYERLGFRSVTRILVYNSMP